MTESPRERQIRLASMTGAERIAAERQRQVDEEGWTAEHDDRHAHGDLAEAAKCYANAGLIAALGSHDDVERLVDPHAMCPSDWPWDARWWKPSRDAATNYAKAGALLAAEIDRVNR